MAAVSFGSAPTPHPIDSNTPLCAISKPSAVHCHLVDALTGSLLVPLLRTEANCEVTAHALAFDLVLNHRTARPLPASSPRLVLESRPRELLLCPGFRRGASRSSPSARPPSLLDVFEDRLPAIDNGAAPSSTVLARAEGSTQRRRGDPQTR